MKNRPADEAATAALTLWYGSEYIRGKHDDPYSAYCFRTPPWFAGECADIALAVWAPFFNSRKELPAEQ